MREKGFGGGGREREWILRVVWLKFEQLALPFEPFEAIGGETIVCKKGEGGSMDPFAQISGESNGPWWKVVTRRGLLSCSIMVIQYKPSPFLFLFFVNFSRRTILKAGTNIQRLFVGYFLKKIYVYTYISSTLLAVSREKSFWKFASQRENQVPRNVCRIFYQILNTMKRLIYRKNFGERELLQVEIVRYFFFSIEY